MTKRIHIIFCWILTISLVWLPLSVSADFSAPSKDENTCHEMNSTVSGHDMSIHSMHSATSGQTAVTANSMQKPIDQKCCCDSGCGACVDMTSCGHSSNHISVFIIINRDTSPSHGLSQSSIEQLVQYHNQIITPDFRPPIV